MTKQWKVNRRGLLRGGGALAAGAVVPWAAGAAAGGTTKLHILGSRAGPSVGGGQYQTSYAVTVGDALYMVDCGYGATEQLVRAGLRPQDLRDLFITHHHPDHNIELGTLIYFAWYAGLVKPLGIYGPPPVKAMTQSYLAALKPDIDIWLDDIGHPPLGPIDVTELSRPQDVMDDGTVKVTCTVVNHPPVVPALGYRFDTPDRSIAFSGDTTPVPAMVELARGADVLVHEAIYTDDNVTANRSGNGDARVDSGESGSAIAGDAQKLLDHVLGSHTKAEDAGRIAAEAGVKTLVLAHTVSLVPGVTDGMWIAAARKHFDGEVIYAHDLMVI
ncbi:MBL fold metallo-hydrolase [Altererythrobacter salegens]|uniref:MBL fold metallo-hydrolase n=1 Tax=Croceibacterium salegens TaxID=1737568 RepID=A0A6I4SRG2_9SPHN|nr:MBL fold metallo-hydrolase [Croceibacterium salegens]MXO57998.1 MBL fold metallo-hydrolase [Croceibacterium salegens]